MRMWIVKRSSLIRWTIIAALILVMIVIGIVACTGGGQSESGEAVMYYEVEALASATKERPIYSVGTQDKLVALSFDAAFDDDKTEKILGILAANDIRATFFLCGFWIDKNPERVKTLLAKGHELGNHSETHPHMTKLSQEKMLEEVTVTGEKLKALTGRQVALFRAPYGEYNDTLIRTMRDAGYVPVQWNIDTLDWQPKRTADTIVKECVKKLAPGSIILCHNNGFTVEEYLPRLIEQAKAKGYSFAPVSELLHSGVTKIDAKGVQWPAS